MAFQLYVDGRILRALNLCSSKVTAFGGEAGADGGFVPAHADLSSRDRVGQAKGMLMERHQITGQQAVLLLPRRAITPTPICPPWRKPSSTPD